MANVILFSFFFSLVPHTVFASITDATDPTSTADEGNGYGQTEPWSTVEYATGTNSQYATNEIPGDGASNYLLLTGYGFDLPTGSVITGILVTLHGSSTATVNFTGTAQLYWDGSGQGDPYSQDVLSSTSLYEFGGGGLWNSYPSESIVEDPGFGVILYFMNDYTNDTKTVSVDNVTMTIYYDAGPTVSIGSPLSQNPWNDTANTALNLVNCPGVDAWTRGRSASLSFTFSEAVTGFTIDDIKITGNGTNTGSLTNFSGSNDIYSVTLTLDPDVEAETIAVSLPEGVSGSPNTLLGNVAYENLRGVTGNTTAFTVSMSQEIGLCDSTYADLYLPLNEDWNSSDAFQPYLWSSPSTHANIPMFDAGSGTGPTSGGCPATTDVANTGSFRFDGVNDYVKTSTLYPQITRQQISLWVKSNEANPSDQTIFQWTGEDGENLVTVRYTSAKQNYLHIATPSNSYISSQSFDITDWNHLYLEIQEDNVGGTTSVHSWFVNGQNVSGNDASPTTISVPNNIYYNTLTIGARYDDNSELTAHFSGWIDEVITPITQQIPDAGTKNTDCIILYKITTLSSESFSVIDATDSTDLHVTGKTTGSYVARLRKSGTPMVDATVNLNQDRSWASVTADTSGNKVVVDFPVADAGTHGHDASQNPHTIYARKDSTISFRVCPGATTLNDVSASCGGGVLFSGPFPQQQDVSGETVTVGTTDINSVTYWYASGLTGSGGEGEGEGEGSSSSVPFFPWWSIPFLLLAGVWFLQQREFLAAKDL